MKRYLLVLALICGTAMSSLPSQANPTGGQIYEKVKTIKGHSGDIEALAFSPDGTVMASGAEDKRVVLWDSPDGKQLASSGQDNIVNVWDVATGESGEIFTEHKQGVRALSYQPNGKLVASADHKTKLISGPWGIPVATKVDAGETCHIWLWDPTSLKVTAKVQSDCDVKVLRFMPDGKGLVAGSGVITLFKRK